MLSALTLIFSSLLFADNISWHPMRWAGKSQFKKLSDGTLVIIRNDSTTSGAWGSKTINVTPGETFEISAEIGTDLKNGYADLAVDFLDKNNKRIVSNRLARLSGKNDFRKTAAQFSIPERTKRICFYAIGQLSSGTVKFRNFSLRKIVLPNVVAKQFGIVWRPKTNETLNKYRFTANELIIERKKDSQTTGKWGSDPIPVSPGEYYNISSELSARNMTALCFVDVYFYDSRNRQVGRKTISRVAEQKTFLAEQKNVAVPAHAKTMRLFAILDSGKGTATFRNIKIKKLPTQLIFSEYAYNRQDRSTRIGWRSTTPVYTPAKVTFKTSGMKDIILKEEIVGVTNHSVILPAGAIPTGKEVTAVISYNKVQKSVKFISGAAKRIAKSKPFSINLSVTEPTASARKVWPVAGGIPFSQGILRDASDVMLTDANGRKVPAEFTVISRWGDGSVQFLGYTFETATNKTKPVVYTLTNSDGKTGAVAKVKSKLLDTITGRIVTADGKVMLCNPRNGKKTVTRSTACTTTEVTGKFSGDAGFGYRLFIRDYPSGISTVQYSIYGGKEDTLIRNIQWEFPALNEPEFSDQSKPGKVFSTLQRDEKNGTGDGFVRDRKANVSIGMRHYREKWPKGIANDDKTLALQLLPPLPADYADSKTLKPLDILIKYYWLKDGCYIYSRNLELTGSFTVAPADAEPEWFKEKLIAAASPEYYCATGVFENIAPRKAGEFDSYEKIMDTGFKNLMKDREQLGQYGWMNLGDWYGERHDNWGNNEYDLAYVMALFFARTADVRYFRRGMEMADHHQAVDRFIPNNPLDRRTKYKHCVGHTGIFLTKEDPRWGNDTKLQGIPYPAFDIEGGHNYETGSLLMAGLAGDKYLFDKTLMALDQMARAFTVEIIFGIERGPGWLMENLVSGLFFTSDPFYRVASEICLDKVYETQSRKNGSMNLPQDVRECTCPDKYSHRGGKPFAVGVLMHSIIRFYNITGSKKAKNCVSDFARWLVDYAWDPQRCLFRYKTGCPFRSSGSDIYPLLLDSLWIVGKWNNDKRYNEIILNYAGINFPRVNNYGRGQGVGKHFCMAYRHTPHLFKLLKDDGITDLKVNLSEAAIKSMKFRKPANTVTVEAENFKSQNGGKVKIRLDKAGADKTISHWDKKGHSITWRTKNPKGKYKIFLRYCAEGNASRDIIIGKKVWNFTISGNGGLGNLPTDWLIFPLVDKNKREIVFDLPKNVEFTMLNTSGTSLNLDQIYLLPVK